MENVIIKLMSIRKIYSVFKDANAVDTPAIKKRFFYAKQTASLHTFKRQCMPHVVP